MLNIHNINVIIKNNRIPLSIRYVLGPVLILSSLKSEKVDTIYQ